MRINNQIYLLRIGTKFLLIIMSFRNEKKYRLSYGDLYELKSQLISVGMKKLYPDRQINSEYLDTKELKMFSDSEEGILPRKKIRIRWYKDKSVQIWRQKYLLLKEDLKKVKIFLIQKEKKIFI